MKAKTRSSKEQAERLIQSVMTLQPEHDAQAKLTSSNLQRCTTSRVCVGIESDPTTLGRNAGLGPHHLKEMMKRLSKSRRLTKWRINASSTPQKGQQILFKGQIGTSGKGSGRPPRKTTSKNLCWEDHQEWKLLMQLQSMLCKFWKNANWLQFFQSRRTSWKTLAVLEITGNTGAC